MEKVQPRRVALMAAPEPLLLVEPETAATQHEESMDLHVDWRDMSPDTKALYDMFSVSPQQKKRRSMQKMARKPTPTVRRSRKLVKKAVELVAGE